MVSGKDVPQNQSNEIEIEKIAGIELEIRSGESDNSHQFGSGP
jgi:hypothetical protein